MRLSLIHHRHIPVILEFFEMPTYKVPKPINGIVRLADLFPKPTKYLSCFIVEKLNQYIVFIFKIEINCPISDSGLFGNL